MTIDHAREEDLEAERASFGLVNTVMKKDAFAVDQFNQPLNYNYKSAKSGPDSAQWTIAEDEELVRLIETTKTMVWIDPRPKPVDRIASYYHPQVKHFVYRVRGVYKGTYLTTWA